MKEIWKDIPGWEGLYQASTLGRIRSYPQARCQRNRWGTLTLYHKKGKILKPNDIHGYQQIDLHRNKKIYSYYVHRLVAITFVPGYKEGMEVNHKNEIRSDNRAENLEWVTHEDNLKYGSHNSRISKSNSKAVLQYSMDGNFIAEYPSATIAAKETGISLPSIAICAQGKFKTMCGYIWKYKD